MAGPRKAELKDLVFQPGVMTNATPRSAHGKWKDSNRVRWHKGFAEKIGGWIRLALAGVNGGVYLGVCRALHDWASLDKQLWIGMGTHCKLYLVNNNVLYDITPARKTSNLANPFTTTAASAIVVVTDVDHRASTGDYITVSDAAAVGGLTLAGSYQILNILTPDTYRITAVAVASGSATGGGTPSITYDIYCGLPENGELFGYGTGVYQADPYTPGSGTGHNPVDSTSPTSYGTPRGAGLGVPAAMRVWSLDNWGEDLVGSFTDGEIYWWDKTNGPNSRATLIQEAPTNVQRILVNPENRFLIAIGCSGLDGVPDAMRVRWCSQENFNDWTPTLNNTAGGKRLDYGSRLVTGLRSRGQNLIWSDTQLYAMQYLGPNSEVFGFQPLGACSIVGPNAAIDVNGIAYFMGFDDFFIYDGTLRPMICDVWTQVFEDFDRTQAQAVYCFSYIPKNEVEWLYVSSLGVRYVAYNYVEECWYYGTMPRSAYHGVSPVMTGYLTNPYAVDSGYMYEHEVGTDEGEGTTTNAMSWFLESWDIGSGSDKFILLSEIVPDFERLLVGCRVLIKYKYNPRDADYSIDGPYDIDESTQRIDPRVRGSQIAIRLENAAASGAGDPFFGFVVLLCHFNGTEGSLICIDSSAYAHAMEINYLSSITNTQVRFGSGSFSSGIAGGARVSYPIAAQSEFKILPGKDFTIEAQVWLPAIDHTWTACIFSLSTAPIQGVELFIEINTGVLGCFFREQDGTPISLMRGVTSIADGAWHHVAVVRSGFDYALYVDGVRVATDSSTQAVMADYTQLCMGMALIGEGNSDEMVDGFIDEVRFTNGAARYTGATFVPPNAEFADLPFTNVALLLHMDSADGSVLFTDSSGFEHTMTAHGAVTATATNPKFGAGAFKSGGSFSVPSYLSTPITPSSSLDLASGDFTAECWVSLTADPAGAAAVIMSCKDAASATGFSLTYDGTNLVGNVYGPNGGVAVKAASMIPGPTYYHVALVVRGGVLTVYFEGSPSGATAFFGPIDPFVEPTFTIGSDRNSSIQSTYWYGTIDEVRIVKGFALYTGPFTPNGPFTNSAIGTRGQDFRLGVWQAQGTPYGDR